jgi:hypothetical protein
MNAQPEIPDITVEESDWACSYLTLSRASLYHPTWITQHPASGMRPRSLAGRVPVDDDNRASFQLDVTHILMHKEGEAYKNRHKARTENLAAHRLEW